MPTEEVPAEPSAIQVLAAEKERMEAVTTGHSVGVAAWDYAVDRLAVVSKSLAYFEKKGKGENAPQGDL